MICFYVSSFDVQMCTQFSVYTVQACWPVGSKIALGKVLTGTPHIPTEFVCGFSHLQHNAAVILPELGEETFLRNVLISIINISSKRLIVDSLTYWESRTINHRQTLHGPLWKYRTTVTINEVEKTVNEVQGNMAILSRNIYTSRPNSLVPYHWKSVRLWRFNIAGKNKT